jgi:thioredoxin reductase
MTAPMDLPLYGKVQLTETKKSELLGIWVKALEANQIKIRENTKVESITREGELFAVQVSTGETLRTKSVLLAIGRRGTPRKLNIPGEQLEKVAYRLLEPEQIEGKNILVVGGGDSAIEAALALSEQNKVVLSYRSEAFQRIKPKNSEKIKAAMANNNVDVRFSSNVLNIGEESIFLSLSGGESLEMANDLVYIFAGGELPTEFLKKAGIEITTRFGHAILKHDKKR